MEIRTIEAEIRMDFDKGLPKLGGLAVPYEVVSDVAVPENPLLKERISRGAFRKSVVEDDIRMLWQHLPQYVLGRNRANTLKLLEDERGVWFEVVPPDVGWAKDLVQSIKRRDITQMSFKFSGTAHYERSGDSYLQIIDEGRLEEVSVVTVPVYQSTSVYSRSAEGNLLVNGKPIELVETKVEIKPQEINMEDLWKRFDAVLKANGGN